MTTIPSMASPTGRVVVVAPCGELTIDDAPALRTALRAPGNEVGLLVVDLLGVESIDDAIVEVLVGASIRSRSAGRQFIVANASTEPWAALTTARMAGVLKLHRRGTKPLSELLQLLEL